MGTQDRGFESMQSVAEIEACRQQTQIELDAGKSIDARRQMGQFSTPPSLAREVVYHGLSLMPSNADIRFLEPAIGTGALFSALLAATNGVGLQSAVGYEADPLYGVAARRLWGDRLNVRIEDFTRAQVELNSINLLITNPPYVRHHYISPPEKSRLAQQVLISTGRHISGLAGLYCYFILLAHQWLAPCAISGWLIPSEFMDVNYGDELKKYLLDDVRLLRIHRYDPHFVKFGDALVSSCVVWFKKQTSDNDYDVEFSYGESHDNPDKIKMLKRSVLLREKKWTRFPCKEQRILSLQQNRLKDFFTIKRGIATGDNHFFILTKRQIDDLSLSLDYFQPILPSPRYLKTDNILSDSYGYPLMEQQYFLLNCPWTEEEIMNKYPGLWQYLQSGKDSVARKYLCASRKRWYCQEKREPAPLLCTYMGRNVSGSGCPFHFILNQSNAVATNSYLMMYPKKYVSTAIEGNHYLLSEIWKYMNSISPDTLESEGRIYGGGLQKIEPRELAEVPCSGLSKIIYGADKNFAVSKQLSLWNSDAC